MIASDVECLTGGRKNRIIPDYFQSDMLFFDPHRTPLIANFILFCAFLHLLLNFFFFSIIVIVFNAFVFNASKCNPLRHLQMHFRASERNHCL